MAALCLAVAIVGVARGDLKPTTLAKPLFAEVTVDVTSEVVKGSLISFDEDGIVIKDGKGERRLRWGQLTVASRHALRAQVMDRKSAAAWLELAEMAVKGEMPEQAKVDVAAAVRLDPTAKLKADAILRRAASGPVKYQKPTPEEDAKAIARYRAYARAVSAELGVEFADRQTPHFLIFTDWDPAMHGFLADSCEEAYRAVSKQFAIPANENVFVGKLPVFMFANREEFQRFATRIDGLPAVTAKNFEGYFAGQSDGGGHMVMPGIDAAKFGNDAPKAWAYTLTHEFTHAFTNRYRTNRRVPRWLSEGLAEWIAYQRYPRPIVHPFARMMAGKKFDFPSLFDDAKFPGGEMYPVMQTMVEAMIDDNRKGFLGMFNDIKDGMEPETAMRKHFKAGYKDWEPAWRRYAKGLGE